MSAVEIRPVSGIAVEPWLDELAELRIRIFRDYPYLSHGSAEYERDYLDRYARSKQSVVVLAMEYNRLIGAATGLPLSDADPEFVAPFERHGPPPEQVFYFGESVLLPAYRGEGVGHRFFDLRELYAQDFGYSLTAFCAGAGTGRSRRSPPVFPGKTWGTARKPKRPCNSGCVTPPWRNLKCKM